MNNQIKYYLRRFVLYYYNFRYSFYFPIAMPIFISVIGAFVFILFILPQITNWFSVQEEVDATQARINMMRQNSRKLESLNRLDVDRDFVVVTEALPSEKNFMGILNAINQAALNSNVSLSDYEFSLGTVSSIKKNKEVSIVSTPININISIDGNVDDVNNFMFEIEKKLPIAEIKTINFSNNSGEILLVFYVKPQSNLDINYSDPIESYTQDERSVIQNIYQWSSQ